jgi:hypothetical protein
VSIIDQHFLQKRRSGLLREAEGGPANGITAGKPRREVEEMPTLINWLEAGRRLAERIPYSFVALLVVGLASRLSALALMVMTVVIQLLVYPNGWPEHVLWFALLLLIIARGPGAISLDHLIWSRTQPAPAPAR